MQSSSMRPWSMNSLRPRASPKPSLLARDDARAVRALRALGMGLMAAAAAAGLIALLLLLLWAPLVRRLRFSMLLLLLLPMPDCRWWRMRGTKPSTAAGARSSSISTSSSSAAVACDAPPRIMVMDGYCCLVARLALDWIEEPRLDPSQRPVVLLN